MSAPPSYTPKPANEPPPAYEFPTVFNIGSKTTIGPLITSNQLKGHLSLLRAFNALRTQVEASEITTFPLSHDKPGERKWALFVALAVER